MDLLLLPVKKRALKREKLENTGKPAGRRRDTWKVLGEEHNYLWEKKKTIIFFTNRQSWVLLEEGWEL